MQDFIHGDKTVVFQALSGEVIGSEKLNETLVSSSGGGGYVGKEGGHVAAAQISSVNVINHEFWIKTSNGKECDVKLRGYDIPLRTGQQITLISAGNKGGANVYHSVLVNHSADKQWVLKNGDGLNKQLALTPYNYKALLIALALWIVLGYVTGAFALGFLVGAVFYGYQYFKDSKRTKAMVSALDNHLAHLVQQSLERHEQRDAA